MLTVSLGDTVEMVPITGVNHHVAKQKIKAKHGSLKADATERLLYGCHECNFV